MTRAEIDNEGTAARRRDRRGADPPDCSDPHTEVGSVADHLYNRDTYQPWMFWRGGTMEEANDKLDAEGLPPHLYTWARVSNGRSDGEATPLLATPWPRHESGYDGLAERRGVPLGTSFGTLSASTKITRAWQARGRLTSSSVHTGLPQDSGARACNRHCIAFVSWAYLSCYVLCICANHRLCLPTS